MDAETKRQAFNSLRNGDHLPNTWSQVVLDHAALFLDRGPSLSLE